MQHIESDTSDKISQNIMHYIAYNKPHRTSHITYSTNIEHNASKKYIMHHIAHNESHSILCITKHMMHYIEMANYGFS